MRTLSNMVEHLSDRFEFWIVTSDRDAFDDRPYPAVRVGEWNEVGKANVFYTRPDQQSLVFFARLIRETPFDILYLNSFFNPVFTLFPLLLRAAGLIPRRPVVIAPRGEFSEGAVSLKAWKKGPYIFTSKLLGLYRNLFWQASSEYEAEDIRRTLGRTAKRIYIAPDLLPPAASLETPCVEYCREKDVLRIVFLSRISPKKNLDFALQALTQVKAPLEFDIYGPVDDKAYWERCKTVMKELPPNVGVQYQGPIEYGQVTDMLATYDLFFFPTRGENFGHVILEALSAGVPVLISDQTPWLDLEKARAGWVLSLENVSAFSETIDRFYRLDAGQRRVWCQGAKDYATKVVRNGDVVKQNIDLFLNAMKNGTKNDVVKRGFGQTRKG